MSVSAEVTFQNAQAALSVFEYIESWYNTDRIHTALEMSIKEFNAINNNHKLVA